MICCLLAPGRLNGTEKGRQGGKKWTKKPAELGKVDGALKLRWERLPTEPNICTQTDRCAFIGPKKPAHPRNLPEVNRINFQQRANINKERYWVQNQKKIIKFSGTVRRAANTQSRETGTNEGLYQKKLTLFTHYQNSPFSS